MIRRLALLALCSLPLVAVGPAGTAEAARPADNFDGVLRAGDFEGLWHGDKVRFIIEKVRPNGPFNGVVRFDKNSRFPNATFAFSGELRPDYALTIDRKDDAQVSKARPPKREAGFVIWKGETTGQDLDRAYPFELRIPAPR
jgi:hypothetical protein